MLSVSLKEFASGTIKTFLQTIGFIFQGEEQNAILQNGILYLVNELADYYEEGTRLFPEIIVVDSIEYFETIPNKQIYFFYNGPLDTHQFCKSLKMCAPLATNGWVIFIYVTQNEMRWGVITSELSETSIPLGIQIIHDRAQDNCHIIYMRNTGQKNVQLLSIGGNSGCQITMSLNDPIADGTKSIDILCDKIMESCANKTEEFDTYIRKIINLALRLGHGNLFIVLQDEQSIPEILKGGVDISEVPIDLYDAYLELKAIGDNNSLVEANYKLHMLSNLAIGMMNQDGITIFTQSAKVIGFHYIVENNVPEVQGVLGGARTKAYEALCRCPLIRTVFMRKQEGETKIHQNYE